MLEFQDRPSHPLAQTRLDSHGLTQPCLGSSGKYHYRTVNVVCKLRESSSVTCRPKKLANGSEPFPDGDKEWQTIPKIVENSSRRFPKLWQIVADDSQNSGK